MFGALGLGGLRLRIGGGAIEEGRGVWQQGVAHSRGAPWSNFVPVLKDDICDDGADLAWCQSRSWGPASG